MPHHPTRPGHAHRADRRPLPVLLRILIPSLLIVAWVAVAGIGGPYFGRVSEVSSNDSTAYLPASAEATQVSELSPEFSGSDAIPAIVVLSSDQELDDDALEEITDAAEALTASDAVGDEVSPAIPSEDRLAVQIIVPIAADADIGDAVDAIDAELAASLPEGITAHVTGPAGFTADLTAAFAGIDGLLLGVALAAVLIILIIVYRSFLLPLIVLSTSVFALCAALLTVWMLAKQGAVMLNGQTQGILFILVIGAATDYSLLLVSRYRDELHHQAHRGPATMNALRGSVEPIVASGGTVIAGLLCLLLSDLKSNSSLGPIAAIGIAFAMLAALTYLPAMLYVAGRIAFWPRIPRVEPAPAAERESAVGQGLWGRIAVAVSRRPRRIWIVTALVLVVGCVGATQLKADGVPQSELVLTSSSARDGQAVLGEHFPAGQGGPAMVILAEEDLQDAADLLLTMQNVDSVAVSAEDSVTGTASITEEGIQSVGAPGAAAPEPTVVDGRIMLQATLSDAPDSDAAEQAVRQMRAELADAGIDALVGGVTATAIDTDDASAHDRSLIIPIVLVVILLILMALLRAVLAPLLLIATTVLSFGAALGVSALVFDHVLGFPGADPAVPLYGFVFLVALGIDYNIFLMTRVREEALAHGPREGVLRGLAVTGGVITSAGLVLAATFAALGVIPILFLAQISFIVAFGVLLDTFVVRSLLVPALALDIGRAIWWPSRLSRR